MHPFEYIRASSLPTALAMMQAHGETGKVLAGGTALMLGLRQRLLAPSHLIDLAKIPQIADIVLDEKQGLRIGALARHQQIAQSVLVRQRCPVFARIAGELANPQVRAQGSLGGNLCYGDPTTDPPGLLLALDAVVHLSHVTAQGGVVERSLAMEDFLEDFFETAIAPNEVLTHISVPKPSGERIVMYERFRKTLAEHRPLVNISIAATLENNSLQDARLVVGATVPVARRLRETEALLQSEPLTIRLAEQVAQSAAQEMTCIDDARASESYRRHIVQVLVRRMLEEKVSA